MPFITHTVVLKKDLSAGTGFAASLKRLKTAPAALSFTLRERVAAELGWADGMMLSVQLGDGEHHGLVRLKADAAGTAKVVRRVAGNGDGKRGGPYIAIALGHVPQFVNRSEAKRWCQFETVEDGWVEVVLPSWADETGIKRQRIALPSQATLQIAPPARTVHIPGDPPPGRSALDQLKSNGGGGATRGAARRRAEARESVVHADAERQDAEVEQDTLDRLAALAQTFRLTAGEARLLKCLMDGRLKTKAMLLDAASTDSMEVDLKTVDVHVHKLRKKLKGHLVEVETVWGQGYKMDARNIARVMVLVDGGVPGRADDEAEVADLADAPDSDAA